MSLAEEIAAALGETQKEPCKTIKRVIDLLGEERARALLAETLQIEAEGGLQTADGPQRRTPGGTFFKLVKDRTTSRERATIFRKYRPAAPAPPPEPLSEEDVLRLSTEVLQQVKGETSVKMTLIGRPGRVIEKGEVVITSMQSSSNLPSLPKGLPEPPGDPTTYIVYIAVKQWRKVKESIQKNPDDRLIIEGYPAFDKRIGPNGTMTLYAQSVTSKLLEQAKREKQRAADGAV